MKTLHRLLISLCFVLYGCSVPSGESDLIVLDVTKSYPEKRINLEDMADITYLQLDDRNKEYLFRGGVGVIGSNHLVIANYMNGDILFFTKEGKPDHKFNRKGKGPGEYNQLFRFLYDEARDELYVHEMNKIRIYSSAGEYKQLFPFPEQIWINDYAFLNDRSIILLDARVQATANLAHQRFRDPVSLEEQEKLKAEHLSSFLRISGSDGHIQEYIDVAEDFFNVSLIAYDEKNQPRIGTTPRIIYHTDGLLLHNQETDTVYLYKQDHTLTPFIVQKPSLKSLNPSVYINSVVDRGEYQFIELQTLKVQPSGLLQSTSLVRDKKDGSVYASKIILSDFAGKDIVIDHRTVRPFQNANEGLLTFTVDELREAYDAGRLSGELKSFVEQMEEENENDVLVMLRFK
ncbi:6-bladed beta-propeller [Parabacteroides sp. PF5-9]|uniref:6-bladed beta-propeller n=1 Tax=Parabacteroides sp. PF5-9 TaxID=1742404 RepID=UPI0024764E15|nr:6-bladed beta-propeller [Parabacteroides sp. PF5-9]MDH6359005.1 hypothetical protein [Parabacteroides sp. PF5-9]